MHKEVFVFLFFLNVVCELKLRFECRLFCKEWFCAPYFRQYLIHASMITKYKIPAEFSQRILMLEAMTVNIRTLESSANPYNRRL